MLELEGIVKAFGQNRVLDGAGLACALGEAVCIVGANAAGKTTLLTVAAGLLKPDGGSRRCPEAIGYVPQEPSLLGDLSVRENLALWYAAYSLPARRMFAAGSAEALLGLEPFARTRAGKLSGGLKKRLAIACALLGGPAYLLLDEPFAALDLKSREVIQAHLRALKEQGKGLLFVSHDPPAAAAIADRVLLLRDGRIARELALSGEPQGAAQIIGLLSGV